jgi:hypothetical protein
MRTQTIETTTHQQNGHMATMFDSSKFMGIIDQEMPAVIRAVSEAERKVPVYTTFFSRPTWIITGVFKTVDRINNHGYTVNMKSLFARPTWITTGAVAHLDNRGHMANAALIAGRDMAQAGQRWAAFFLRPTWITTGVFQLGADCHDSAVSSGGGSLDDKRLDHPDAESLRSATAVLALEMALASFRGNQRIYPRRKGATAWWPKRLDALRHPAVTLN